MHKQDTFFSESLLNWYAENQRDLPWRGTRDPYKIWLSEIILQQTRVAQGLPYYERFIERFPTVKQLAKAEEQEVLRLWQGLGYYSRARNLHACVRKVESEYGGIFPEGYAELQKLPGIGKYTAAAIASFAFHESVPVVDGNVLRVLARYFGIAQDIGEAKNWSVFFSLAQKQLGSFPPQIFNQAIMEFGAVQCKPGMPNCETCPVRIGCYAAQEKQQLALPVKVKKTKIRPRYFTYWLVQNQEGEVAVQERKDTDIWKGLYHFPLLETESLPKEEEVLKALPAGLFIQELPSGGSVSVSPVIKHVLSHQHLFIRFIHVKEASVSQKGPWRWVNTEQLQELPKPIVIDKYLQEYLF
ncbi:A/G-specific adenine glycosylase [Cytophagales bacterium LB-30]|uniref:Adenine DNA glycosylase n=1 Tax=Shiella aurantiaca TaxID=3058365 RepID=A0ABT8F615_9BACT|nr:A/G-specific adenine glycosylase [Shiella aurantiaca]MDN4165671.1 A/G-specific adenine glycosylase [Shiella aurantiaca]